LNTRLISSPMVRSFRWLYQPKLLTSTRELALEPSEVAARDELAHARQPQVRRDHALPVAVVAWTSGVSSWRERLVIASFPLQHAGDPGTVDVGALDVLALGESASTA
jgi:hypothetical protein